jgi:GTPase
VILSDTVGFIHDLPPDLVSAFLATLEELQTADLLIHVVDAANPHAEAHIGAVGRILDSLGLAQVPRIVAFNKMDRVDSLTDLERLCRAHDGLPISALRRETLRPLLARAARLLWPCEAVFPAEAEDSAVGGHEAATPTAEEAGPDMNHSLSFEIIHSRGGVTTERLVAGIGALSQD